MVSQIAGVVTPNVGASFPIWAAVNSAANSALVIGFAEASWFETQVVSFYWTIAYHHLMAYFA